MSTRTTRCWLTTLLLPLPLLAAGCATSKSSNTARTATEQMLISNAVDQSLNKVDFQPFRGHTVYLNEKFVDCVDKNYLVASVRHRVLAAGGILVDDPAQAEVLMELRSGAMGTDTAESFVGIPEVTLPGMLTLPEVRLLTRSAQKGIAKIGLVAVDAQTKQVLGSGGMSLAQSDTQNWYVMGVGPFRSGTIHSELETSTSGAAAQTRNWIPASVAFRSPPAVEKENLRYAAQEDADATPAGFAVPAVPPAETASGELAAPRRLSNR